MNFNVKSCTTEHYIDRSLCIECNNCELGCAARHGETRLQRRECLESSLTENIPRSCQQCYERSCVKACKFGAMRIDKDSEIVFTGGNCVGCSLCAKACPLKAINMIEKITITNKDRDNKDNILSKWFSKNKKEVKLFANKCDLCLGYKDQACVKQCPTGALKVRLIDHLNQEEKKFTVINEETEVEESVEVKKNKPKLEQSSCVKCGLCAKKCPSNAISMEPYPVVKDAWVSCGVCVDICPKKALCISKADETFKEMIFSLEGEKSAVIHVSIKLDSSMTENKLKGLIKVLKSELREKGDKNV